MALLKKITGPDNLKAINTAADSLDDKESVALAQAASAGIARLEAIRYRALAQLNRHREGARSVAQEVAFALSVGDKYAAGPDTVLRRIVTDSLSRASHRSRPGPVSPDSRSGRVRPGAGS